MKAHLKEGWHLYSQDVKDGGPIPTTFTFSSFEGFELLGGEREPQVPALYDDVLMEVEISHSSLKRY